VKAVVNVLLPAGAYEPTPLGTSGTDAGSNSESVSGQQAVTDLLQAGLI
jgi:hypothetical protein